MPLGWWTLRSAIHLRALVWLAACPSPSLLMGLMEIVAALSKCLPFPHLLCMATELSHVVTVCLLFPVQINEYSFSC